MIVDSSVKTITADAVYAIQYADSVFIERVQSHPDGTVLLISNNEVYKPIVVNNPETLTVVGRAFSLSACAVPNVTFAPFVGAFCYFRVDKNQRSRT